MKLRTTIIHLLIITLTVGAVYVWSLNSDFVYDDHQLIVRNTLVQGQGSVADAFKSPYYPGLKYYRPIGLTTYLTDYQLWGTGEDGKPRPAGYHATNTLLHLLCCFLVYAALRRWLPGTNSRWALVGALLFAVHPAASSAVLPITARESILCLLFSLACLLLWSKGSIGSRVGSLICLALALLSKEMAVALPPVLFVYDLLGRAPNGPVLCPRRIGRALLAQIPIALIVAAYFFARSRVLAQVPGPEFAWGSPADFLLSFAFMLRMTLWPAIGLLYEPSVGTWLNIFAVIATAIILILLVIHIIQTRTPRIAWFWLAWAVLFYLPTSNIIRQETIWDERYLYLPLVGIIAFVFTVLRSPARQESVTGPADAPASAPAQPRLFTAALIAVIVLAGLAVSRTAAWKNDDEFYANWLHHEPLSSIALYGVAKRLDEEGNTAEALDHYQKAVDAGPNNHRVRNDYGVLLEREGRTTEAEAMYRDAIRINPQYTGAMQNLGTLLAKKQDYQEAALWYARVVEGNPADWRIYLNYGELLARSNQERQAADAFRSAVNKFPRNETLRFTLAKLLVQSKDQSLNNPADILDILSPMTTDENAPIRRRFDFWLIVGDAFLRLNRPQEANQAYQNALKLLEQSNQHDLAETIRQKLRELSNPPPNKNP